MGKPQKIRKNYTQNEVSLLLAPSAAGCCGGHPTGSSAGQPAVGIRDEITGNDSQFGPKKIIDFELFIEHCSWGFVLALFASSNSVNSSEAFGDGLRYLYLTCYCCLVERPQMRSENMRIYTYLVLV